MMNEPKEPPLYFNGGGSQQLQMAYLNQQSPYMGQQPLPGMGYQPTTIGMNQLQSVPTQLYPTRQPSMMLNHNTGVGQQPMQPQTATVLMPGPMPVSMPIPQYLTLCQQGQHDLKTRYRPCGIITAVVFFPIGLIALFLDVEERCTRCGARFKF